MVRGRLREEWQQTAMLYALVYNRTRTSNEDRPLDPAQVVPANLREAPEQTTVIGVPDPQFMDGKGLQTFWGL